MKKIISTVAAAVAIATIAPATASAWTYSIKATGSCQPDGSYQINWTIKNPENQPFTVRATSAPSVVSVGSTVAAKNSKVFTQSVDGTQTGQHTLTVSGDWPSDRKDREMTKTHNQYVKCEQPGGKGGDTPETPETPVVETPVVEAVAPAVVPVGAVSAGTGSTAVNAAGVAALLASLAAVAVGVIRRVQKG